METTSGKERDKYLGWWSTMETFGLIPSRGAVASCVVNPEKGFPVSFRYFQLLDTAPAMRSALQHDGPRT